MNFFIRQQIAQGIYLLRANIPRAMWLQRLQQAIRPHAVHTVFLVVGNLPRHDALTLHGKLRNAAVSSIDAKTYRADFFRSCLNLPYPLSLMHKDGGYTDDDRHQYGISCQYLPL